MNKIFRISFFSLAVLALFSFLASAAQPDTQDKNTQQAISYLINAVASSHLTFIRNGEEHTSDEAMKHMMEKYDYFKSRIKSPEDFIRLCASRSLLSGKPYLVETDHGVVPTETWLLQVLGKYREGQKSF